jgi:YesN/AraC family two-component response regulator
MAGRIHNGAFKSKSGGSFFIYKAISGSNDWTYISVVPEEIVLSKVAYIKQVTGFVTLVTFLIGAVAAGYFSYRNSTPIKRLMNKVAVFLRGSTEHPFNENDDLESSITKLIHSNESLREKMSDQLPLIKMSLFRRLLNGEFADENEINALLSYVNVHLENKKLAVILLKLQRKTNYLDRHELQKLDFVKLIAQDILEQSANTECYTYEVDQNNTAFILSFDEKLSNYDCRRMIGDLARVLCDKLYLDYHTKAVVSCGDIYKGIRNIAVAFDEAKQAMEYAIINEPGGLIRYDEIPKDTEKWFFPFELEMRLISLTKSGEKEGVYSVIDDIYKENMERRNLSPAMLKQLLLLMKCSAVRAFGQSAEEQTVGNYPDLTDEHANVEELFTGMKEMYLQICDNLSGYKERSNQQFCKRLTDYVTQHYMDENLTIHTVSEHFNSTKSYIYQFFKDHMGMTFTDYLEQLRIQQACRLMQETDLTIKDVAQQTGYNSDHSFRRAFKRVMGLVPTEYAKATREVQM